MENEYNDFTVQLLMPNFLSRQGPCIAVGDINKDGLDDMFSAVLKGMLSAIYLQNETGGFVLKQDPLLLPIFRAKTWRQLSSIRMATATLIFMWQVAVTSSQKMTRYCKTGFI